MTEQGDVNRVQQTEGTGGGGRRGPEMFRAPRAAAVAGILFGVLFTTAIVLMRIGVPRPDADGVVGPTTPEIRQILEIVGLYLLPFAGMAFLWLMAVVRDRIGAHEDRFYGTVFLGSGLLFVAMMFAAAAVGGSTAAASAFMGLPGLDVEFSGVLRSISYTLLYVYAVKMSGAFMLVTAAIARRTHIYPGWVSWSGIVIALALLVSVTFAEILILLFPAWVIMLSVYSLITHVSVRDALSLERESG